MQASVWCVQCWACLRCLSGFLGQNSRLNGSGLQGKRQSRAYSRLARPLAISLERVHFVLFCSPLPQAPFTVLPARLHFRRAFYVFLLVYTCCLSLLLCHPTMQLPCHNLTHPSTSPSLLIQTWEYCKESQEKWMLDAAADLSRIS